MTDTTTKNPLGIKTFAYLEFTTDTLSEMEDMYNRFGFVKTAVSEHPDKTSWLMSAGRMTVVLTHSKITGEYNHEYLKKHFGGVSAIAFWVDSADAALNEAVRRGAKKLEDVKVFNLNGKSYKRSAIQGFGDVRNIFVETDLSMNDQPGFVKIENPKKIDPAHDPKLVHLDHLTNNVPHGEMNKWVKFYEDIFGFESVKYFEIKGEKTALRSKVVRSHDKAVCIPINEPWDANGLDQITEYIKRHNGHGVQHIAMSTGKILPTVQTLKKNGFEFLTPPPHTYYEMLPNRVPNFNEDIPALEAEAILGDGDNTGYLLQIFTKDQIGPVFYEVIERHGHDGFGDGNFQALFDAIERDQVIRGVLK